MGVLCGFVLAFCVVVFCFVVAFLCLFLAVVVVLVFCLVLFGFFLMNIHLGVQVMDTELYIDISVRNNCPAMHNRCF